MTADEYRKHLLASVEEEIHSMETRPRIWAASTEVWEHLYLQMLRMKLKIILPETNTVSFLGLYREWRHSLPIGYQGVHYLNQHPTIVDLDSISTILRRFHEYLQRSITYAVETGTPIV